MTGPHRTHEEVINMRRILVVEDRADLRSMYVGNVNEYIENVSVDATDSRDGALELLRRNTYHAALLDIMLIEDTKDDGGIVVLDKIVELSEGTLVVMLSGAQDISHAIHALRSRICVDYIHKSETKTPAIYIDPLRVAARDAHIRYYGEFGGLTAYLAKPELGTHWEFDASQTLGGSGVETLNRALVGAFGPLAPLLRLRNKSPSIILDRATQSIYGSFWSKGRGLPVWVWIGAKKSVETPPEGVHEVLSKGTVGSVRYVVYRNDALSRDDFVELITE